MNVLFDRETLKFAGLNRPALPFEVSVSDVDPAGITKTIAYTEKIHKVNEVGEKLYYLPQPDLEEKIYEEQKIETIEKTSEPVIHIEYKKVPVLDDNGNHMEYEVMESKIIPAVIDEETGEVIEEEKIEYIPTGIFRKCYTTEPVESQKEDEKGRKLYYKTVEEEITKYIPQDPIIITETDERYTEGLEPVLEEIEKEKTISFEEHPYEFTLEDILLKKYQDIVDSSPVNHIIAEVFTEDITDKTYDKHFGNTGFGFISLPAGKRVKTLPYQLDKPTKTIHLLDFEADEGIEIRYGNTLITKDKPLELTSEVEEIAFIIINKAESERTIRSFAFGY